MFNMKKSISVLLYTKADIEPKKKKLQGLFTMQSRSQVQN